MQVCYLFRAGLVNLFQLFDTVLNYHNYESIFYIEVLNIELNLYQVKISTDYWLKEHTVPVMSDVNR